MKERTRVWLLGAAAAIVSGAGGGLTTGLAAIGIRPDVFNVGAGLGDTAKICAASALWSAVNGLGAYLKTSPIPGSRATLAGMTVIAFLLTGIALR